MKGRMYISIKELDRVHIIERVSKGEISGSKASKALNISERQVKRLKKRYKEKGAEGLFLKRWGPRVIIEFPKKRPI